MRTLKILIVVLLVNLIFSSCMDIVDSDKNIKITEIKYNYVKSDQENDVILPLKAGNKWYYDVYFYALDSTSYNIDSMEVIREVILNNEKWFEVRMPMFATENVFLTNTDVGLWLKCDECLYKSFLLAKYPDVSKDFVSGYFDAKIISDSNGNYSDSLTRLAIIKTIDMENITVPVGNFNCYKYESYFVTNEGERSHVPLMTEYYAVGQGIVKTAEYYFNDKKIAKVFELREKPGNENNGDCIETLDINVGEVAEGSIWQEQIELFNNTSNKILVKQAIVVSESDAATFVITSQFINSLPLELLPGESKIMTIDVKPKRQKRFFGVIKVMALGCFYEIKIQGMTK